MDDGRLTDGQGRTVDFRNTVLIMTSNIGSQRTAEDLASTDAEREHETQAALKAQFRPEFLNRIDAIVPFHRLGLEQVREIAEVQIKLLQARLAERKVGLELTPQALALLAEQGFDPVYGARPLKRVIQDQLADPLAMDLLDGTLLEGQSVKAEVKKGSLALVKSESKA
jgi:ATP-dependent Clp protease ATP-binding subunit ClpB